MITAIIIDDEAHCIDRLQQLVDRHCPSIQLHGAFRSVPEGIAAIRQLQPALVFLDVQIGDQTGFDLLRAVKPDFRVIFTTAFDTYAVQAFKFSAVDYLLKPIDADDLIQAVAKVGEKQSSDELNARFDALLHNMAGLQGASRRISIPTASGLLFVQVSDIIRCEAEDNYTLLYQKAGPKIVVSKTLKEFESLLEAYGFFRVHHAHLINLACIKSYNKGKGGSVTMTDGSVIDVSVRKKDDFMRRLSAL